MGSDGVFTRRPPLAVHYRYLAYGELIKATDEFYFEEVGPLGNSWIITSEAGKEYAYGTHCRPMRRLRDDFFNF